MSRNNDLSQYPQWVLLAIPIGLCILMFAGILKFSFWLTCLIFKDRKNSMSYCKSDNEQERQHQIKRENWMRENNISQEQLEELRATRRLRKLAQSKKRNKK